MTEKSILLETANLAKITLNAPHKLNALNMDMIVPLGNMLNDWRLDDKVKAILIKGAGDRAFCAGGDVVGVTEQGKTDKVKAAQFFWAEYRTNWRIQQLKKPYIAFMDGIVMGGGVGVSVHGRFRVVTERTMFAMPETTIGFFPDVGATYILANLADNVGMFLALTGNRLYAADLIKLGIATHYIHSSKLDELEAALEKIDYDVSDYHNSFDAAQQILDAHCGASDDAPILPYEQIKALFEAESLDELTANLTADDSEFSLKTQKTIARMSPISLRVTFAQLKNGAKMRQNLQSCLTHEWFIAKNMLDNKDFYEGVRALLVDKDKNPQWQPDISDDAAKAYLTYEKTEIYFNWNQPVEYMGDKIIDN